MIAVMPDNSPQHSDGHVPQLGAPIAGEPAAIDHPAPGEYRELMASDIGGGHLPRRQVMLPLLLFLATCASTFWVGASDWEPLEGLGDLTSMGAVVRDNWQQGLTYMGAVLAILLTHEMGHFVQTLRHHIPASYPLCIPVPFNPIGTMGAVISMDGSRADRREIFDIGLAGPLAGLVVAVPILWIGVKQLDLQVPVAIGPNDIELNSPLIATWMIEYIHPQWSDRAEWIPLEKVNAFYMAGWVGMLITGLNMMPISQLDGGHTLYGLFGRRAHTYARMFVMAAVGYVVIYIEQAAIWTPMLVLVILMGIHHPPTSNDRVELDRFRWLLGVASLSIPVLCFPLLGIRQ
jgi:membrane-associated protease RseP (regulator of RpoE activity)